MDGLMIDLRFNGGGSLQEAIEMTGLFIPDGPVVQVRNTDQSVDKMDDTDGGEMYYDGPLAVMVNRGSASASEIFSGAIQDYKRGIIIGESTFGKGTVQNVIDLNRLIRNQDMKLGQLKMTLAKFYRVTGSSNQRIGIAPDVQFPSLYDADEYGEASRPNSLPWDEIADADFEPTNSIDEELVDNLNVLYRNHLNTDPNLQKLMKEIEEAKARRSESTVSLNYDERRTPTGGGVEGGLSASTGQDVEEEDSVTNKLNEDPYLKEGLRLLAEVARKKVG
jgi:carboxyl-terminal processing protease